VTELRGRSGRSPRASAGFDAHLAKPPPLERIEALLEGDDAEAAGASPS
jgi:hypothetical protein